VCRFLASKFSDANVACFIDYSSGLVMWLGCLRRGINQTFPRHRLTNCKRISICEAHLAVQLKCPLFVADSALGEQVFPVPANGRFFDSTFRQRQVGCRTFSLRRDTGHSSLRENSK